MGEANGPQSRWNDERVERILGTLLQSGVIISGLVVLAGGILYLLRYAHLPVQYENFVAERERLRNRRQKARAPRAMPISPKISPQRV